MPFKKGTPKPPGSGRKPNTPNKVDASLAERIAQWGCRPPQQTLALINDQKLPCGVCRGSGVTKYQPKRQRANPNTPEEIADWAQGQEFEQELDLKERKCQSCYGSGFERLKPTEVERAASSLIKFLERPMPMAVEVSGNIGISVVDRLHAGRQRILEDAKRN